MENTNTYNFTAVPEGYSIVTDAFGNTRVIEFNPSNAHNTAAAASYPVQNRERIQKRNAAAPRSVTEKKSKRGFFAGKKKNNPRKPNGKRPDIKRPPIGNNIPPMSTSAAFSYSASEKNMARGYTQNFAPQYTSRANPAKPRQNDFANRNVRQYNQYGNINTTFSGDNSATRFISQSVPPTTDRPINGSSHTAPTKPNTRQKVDSAKKSSGKVKKNNAKAHKKASRDVLYENLRQQNPRVRRARRFRNNYLYGKPNPDTASAKSQRFRLKVKRKAMLSLLLGRFMIFLVFFVLMLAVAGGVFYVILKLPPEADTTPYTLIINSQTEDKESYELPMDDFYMNGGLYLDMSVISGAFDITTTGNVNNLRYVNSSNGDELRVTVGSSMVTMNTVSVPLSRPVIRRGDSVLIPVEFFSNYVEGITLQIEIDQNKGTKKIYLDQTVEGYDSSVLYGNKAIYTPISFALKDPSAANNIPENSLPTDILYETDPLRLAEEAIKAAEEAKRAEEEAKRAEEAANGNTATG